MFICKIKKMGPLNKDGEGLYDVLKVFIWWKERSSSWMDSIIRVRKQKALSLGHKAGKQRNHVNVMFSSTFTIKVICQKENPPFWEYKGSFWRQVICNTNNTAWIPSLFHPLQQLI